MSVESVRDTSRLLQQNEDQEVQAFKALRASEPGVAASVEEPSERIRIDQAVLPTAPEEEARFSLEQLVRAFHTVSVLHDIAEQMRDDKRRQQAVARLGEPEMYSLKDLRKVCERMGIEGSFVEAVQSVLFPTKEQTAAAIAHCGARVPKTVGLQFISKQVGRLLKDLLGRDNVEIEPHFQLDSFEHYEQYEESTTRKVKTGWFSSETVTETHLRTTRKCLGEVLLLPDADGEDTLYLKSKSPILTALISPHVKEWQHRLRDIVPLIVEIEHSVAPEAYLAALEAKKSG